MRIRLEPADEYMHELETAETFNESMYFNVYDPKVDGGDDEFTIDGYGLRDHSWGPRSWQAPYWYRWLTCNAGPDDGFMVSIVASRDGKVRRSGMVFENGGYTPILDATLETVWTEG